ncbi:MAG: signal recognition particle receptor subunit alpha [Myxococcota bacterium]
MLETLTRGFRGARERFRGITRLTDENVDEALREVRMSLLEADVDLGIVRDFLERVKQRCGGQEVRLRARQRGRAMQVTPGDHFTRACYEELVALMGEENPIRPATESRTLMLVGLQGTGKTSTAAKLALHLRKGGERPLLVAADVRRPAAREQLRVLGEQVGVEVFAPEGTDAPRICEQAVAHAHSTGLHTVILDTAGRLQIDEELMAELAQIGARLSPESTILVCDSMAGREAVNVARGFADRLKLDGLVLTKLDGDARGGAALAIREATGVPVRYVTTGERVDQLETFRPEGLASRILGMGDVVGLMRDFEEVVDTEKAEKDAERMLRGSFTLGDFLTQFRTLQRMGPMRELIEKLPFGGDLLPDGAEVDPGHLRRIEAMILSMTPGERTRPEVIDPSRRRRIASGSGTREAEIDDLLQRFQQMQTLLGGLGKGGKALGGLGKLLGGGGVMPPGIDPAALGLGGAPNRRGARAMKADARRKQRKSKRRHVRRSGRRR